MIEHCKTTTGLAFGVKAKPEIETPNPWRLMYLFDLEDFKYPPPNEFSLGKEQAKERKSGFAPSMSFLKESIRPKTDAKVANLF